MFPLQRAKLTHAVHWDFSLLTNWHTHGRGAPDLDGQLKKTEGRNSYNSFVSSVKKTVSTSGYY